jgi:alpha-ribazole phosphatase
LYGKTDVYLSKNGWAQMRQQSLRLEHVNNVISSPLRRCKAFAEEFAASHELPVVVEQEMQECDFGEWDGIEFDDHSQHWPLMTSFWQNPEQNQPPQGESLQTFHDRVTTSWDNLCKTHKGQHNLLVCHGGVIRQILAHVLPADWRSGDWYSQLQISYASLTRITIPAYPNAAPIINFIGVPADFGQHDFA